LSEKDRLVVSRARKLQRFMSQPFEVAEVFTGFKGKRVALKDTIEAATQILAGEHDSLPEQAFYMVGAISEVHAKAAKLVADIASDKARLAAAQAKSAEIAKAKKG